MKSRACKGCTMRTVGCHGKNPDGSWKCRYWGEEQESKAAERQETAHQNGGQRPGPVHPGEHRPIQEQAKERTSG